MAWKTQAFIFYFSTTQHGNCFCEVLKSWYRLHYLTFGLWLDTSFLCFAWQHDEYQLAAENKPHRAEVLSKGITNRGLWRAEYLLLYFLQGTPDHCGFAAQHSLSWCTLAITGFITGLLQAYKAKEMHCLLMCFCQTLTECCEAGIVLCLCGRNQHSCWKTYRLVKIDVEDYITCFPLFTLSSLFPD